MRVYYYDRKVELSKKDANALLNIMLIQKAGPPGILGKDFTRLATKFINHSIAKKFMKIPVCYAPFTENGEYLDVMCPKTECGNVEETHCEAPRYKLQNFEYLGCGDLGDSYVSTAPKNYTFYKCCECGTKLIVQDMFKPTPFDGMTEGPGGEDEDDIDTSRDILEDAAELGR